MSENGEDQFGKYCIQCSLRDRDKASRLNRTYKNVLRKTLVAKHSALGETSEAKFPANVAMHCDRHGQIGVPRVPYVDCAWRNAL